MAKEYQDYKYVLQDTGNLYLGAKYTYKELIDEEDVPFKFKTIVERYIKPYRDENVSLESHFYYMNEKDFVYQTYNQLKIRIKYSVLVEKKTLFGKKKRVYDTKILKLDQFMEIPSSEKEKMGIMIQEIALSKLALIAFNV